MSKTIDIPEAKSLYWLVFNFPLTIPAKDDGDRLCNSIHAYAKAGAEKIEEQARRSAALESQLAKYEKRGGKR